MVASPPWPRFPSRRCTRPCTRGRARSGSTPARPPSSATTSSTPSCAAPRPTAPSACAGSRASPHPDPNARPRRTGRSEGLARWDGGGVVGYVALAEALDREADDAPAGARLVVVERCFPTGRLGWFAERVAGRGLVCLVTATSTARIAHPDGGPPILGTNPICLALPGDRRADGRGRVDGPDHLRRGAARRRHGRRAPARRRPPPRRLTRDRSRRDHRRPGGDRPVRRGPGLQGIRPGRRSWSCSAARSQARADSRSSRFWPSPTPRRSRACASSWASTGSPATAAPRCGRRRCGEGAVAIPDDLWAWLREGG